jgi:hypothetical protein
VVRRKPLPRQAALIVEGYLTLLDRFLEAKGEPPPIPSSPLLVARPVSRRLVPRPGWIHRRVAGRVGIGATRPLIVRDTRHLPKHVTAEDAPYCGYTPHSFGTSQTRWPRDRVVTRGEFAELLAVLSIEDALAYEWPATRRLDGLRSATFSKKTSTKSGPCSTWGRRGRTEAPRRPTPVPRGAPPPCDHPSCSDRQRTGLESPALPWTQARGPQQRDALLRRDGRGAEPILELLHTHVLLPAYSSTRL